MKRDPASGPPQPILRACPTCGKDVNTKLVPYHRQLGPKAVVEGWHRELQEHGCKGEPR